jgi:O-antigen/teichoic acid export membrane protein
LNKLVKLGSDTVLYGASTIIGRLINWLLTPLYIHTLIQEDFGVVVKIYSLIAILLVINTLGFETAYFRFAKEYVQNKVTHTLLFGISILSILFVILAFTFRSFFGSFISDFSLNESIIVLAVSIVALDSVNAIPFAMFRFENKAIKYSSYRLLQIVLTILFNLFYLVFCPYLETKGYELPKYIYTQEWRLIYVFISNFLSTFIIFLLLIPVIFNKQFIVEFEILKKALHYSMPIVLVGLFGMANMNIDKLLMTFLVHSKEPYKELAIYGANFKIGMLMAMFTQSFRLAFEPFFFKEGKSKNSNVIYSQILRYFTFFGMLIFLGITLFIDWVNIILTPEYYEGNRIVPFILLSQLFFGIYYSLSLWYKLTDRTIYGSYMSFGGLIINLAGLFLLVPFMGYYGAAISVSVSFFIMMVVSYLLGQKFYPINYKVPRILGLIIIGLVLFFLNELFTIEREALSHLFKGALILFYIFVFLIFEKTIKKDS